jgi:hypothetical protein
MSASMHHSLPPVGRATRHQPSGVGVPARAARNPHPAALTRESPSPQGGGR